MTLAPAPREAADARSSWRLVLAALAFALAGAHLAVIAAIDAVVSADYEWAINGPPPFDQFGGGPYMLGLHAGFALAILGFTAAAIALLVHARWLLVSASVAAGVGVLVGPWGLLLAEAL